MTDHESRFPIPVSLHDLEREPYHLLPYPVDFADEHEAARADAFADLVRVVQTGNRRLAGSHGMALFVAMSDDDGDDDVCDGDDSMEDDPWMDEVRMQAMYTLVRKSTSLAPPTRQGLAEALSTAVRQLCRVLRESASAAATTASTTTTTTTTTAPQAFRDALACHLYMLYSFLFFLNASEATNDTASSGMGSSSSNNSHSSNNPSLRTLTASALLHAAHTMATYRGTLWPRGVADEAVVGLPCRIAYPLLEASTGVQARQKVGGDTAIRLVAVTVAHHKDILLTTVTAALLDLLHSFEHMAAVTVELVCCSVVEGGDDTEGATNATDTTRSNANNDRLAVELLREIGRLDGSDPKAVGIKTVAPFVALLAERRPRLVWQNLSHLSPHWQSEPYTLRSSLATAVSHILVYLSSQQQQQNRTPSTQDPAPETHDAPLQDISKSREALLDVLVERVYDTSSFTRATVLKAWIRLVFAHAVPKERLLDLTRLAMDRLQDKTVLVRKQAMQLVTVLLECHPFGGTSLAPAPFRHTLAEVYAYVQSHLPEHVSAAHAAAVAEVEAEFASVEEEEEDGTGAAASNGRSKAKADRMAELERATLATAMEEADQLLAESADSLTEAQQTFCNKVQALKFTQSALDFIELFEHATEALEGMLLSANTSDVTEALRFFVQARHFSLPCAVTGMKRALALMWSPEASIRDEVLRAFVDVFVAVPGTDGKDRLAPTEIAKNLIVLTGHASVSELASIEEALVRLVTEERLPDDVFLILWSIASQGTAAARATALQLLSMGAGADRSLVDSKSRLKLLLDAGLGERGRVTESMRLATGTDAPLETEPSDSDTIGSSSSSSSNSNSNHWKLARASAVCLQRIARAQVDPTDAKYLVLERIMDELCTICRGDECRDEDPNDTLEWFSAAEQSIKALFVISPQPEAACHTILLGMYQTTLHSGLDSVHSLRLARFFHMLGHIALNLLVYTEALSASVRRANAKRSLKVQEEADQAKARKRANDESSDDDDAIEAELGVAAEAEAENERQLAEISEHEIVGRNLIGMFGPILVRVVGNEGGKFHSEILMQASTLALCKLMCVSSTFCEKHLPLLFTALANAPPEDTTMRANTVVALGDLAFRFPNEVEPYTPRLYACLRDASTKVRRHTLMVLTHLILNDMVKVKGQVCEVAMCLRDDDSRIRDMSRLLFHELSKRSNNPIYNLLPEIISELSRMSIAKEDFRSILAFLLGYIKKERQNEMLADKLCQRFPKCSSVTQSADLAYCLAQLKVSEKSIKCLSDNFALYKDSLFDEDVLKSFAAIVTKAKKLLKPDRRQLLDEWEAKLDAFASAGAENERADRTAAKAKQRASRRAARLQQQQSQQLNLPDVHEEDEENDDDDDGMDNSACAKGEEENLDFDQDTTQQEDKENTRRSSRRARAVA